MRDGFKVLRYEDGVWQGQIVQPFDDHDSLAYGVDWSFEPLAEDGKQLVGSCVSMTIYYIYLTSIPIPYLRRQ